jgi:hypothetical protein
MRCVITTPAHLDRLLDAIAADEHRSAKQQMEYWVCRALLSAVNARARDQVRDMEEYQEVADAPVHVG